MKKILYVLSILVMISLILFSLTGCGKEVKKVDLDLAKVKENVSNLTEDEFDISTAENNIMELEIPNLSSAISVYDYDFKNYGLTAENIQDLKYRFSINTETKDLFAILLPVEGKKDEVKQQMDAYINKLESEETNTAIKEKISKKAFEEYQGYLIYVVSDNNDAVLNAIKDAKAPILSAVVEVSTEQIETQLGIKQEDVQEFLMETPMMIVNANTYIVVKPAEGKKDVVKQAISEYMSKLEQQWATYLPDQYEIVKNRMEKEEGDYLIYIATTDNEKVYNAIINSTK